jgi:hypothetical protein
MSGKCGRNRQATDYNIRRMHFTCWITKLTDTLLDYAILTAFPRQQWLRERAQCNVVHILAVLYFNVFISLARNNAVRDTGYL